MRVDWGNVLAFVALLALPFAWGRIIAAADRMSVLPLVAALSTGHDPARLALLALVLVVVILGLRIMLR